MAATDWRLQMFVGSQRGQPAHSRDSNGDGTMVVRRVLTRKVTGADGSFAEASAADRRPVDRRVRAHRVAPGDDAPDQRPQ
jgi:hypothetical protein